MRQKSTRAKEPAEKTVRDIRRRTRKQHSAEEKIRIVLEGLRGEDSIAALCRREGIAESLYYSWSKEFLEAGKKRLAGDTSRRGNMEIRCHTLPTAVPILKKFAFDLMTDPRIWLPHHRRNKLFFNYYNKLRDSTATCSGFVPGSRTTGTALARLPWTPEQVRGDTGVDGLVVDSTGGQPVNLPCAPDFSARGARSK